MKSRGGKMVAEMFSYDSRTHNFSDTFIEQRWNGRKKKHFWGPDKILKADQSKIRHFLSF